MSFFVFKSSELIPNPLINLLQSGVSCFITPVIHNTSVTVNYGIFITKMLSVGHVLRVVKIQ